MPNYVYNVLTIIGDSNMIEQFYNENKKENIALSFNNSVPEPDYGNWYDWRIENWGCKWDAGDPEFSYINEFEQKKGRYTFSTAWSPPMKWIKSVSIKYPSLTFYIKFEEEVYSFFGLEKYQNGNNTIIEHYSYNHITNYLISNCNCYPEDLLQIAKKYNYNKKTHNENYEKFINKLDEICNNFNCQYKFCSSTLENIIIDLI